MKGSVSVSPELDLIFKKLDGQSPASYFTIHNDMDGPVVYKVKVTHPAFLSVTPPYGSIAQSGKAHVDVDSGKSLPNNPRLQVLIYPGEAMEKFNSDSIAEFIKTSSLKEISAYVLHCKVNIVELPTVEVKDPSTTPKSVFNTLEYRTKASTSTPVTAKRAPERQTGTPLIVWALILFLILFVLYFMAKKFF